MKKAVSWFLILLLLACCGTALADGWQWTGKVWQYIRAGEPVKGEWLLDQGKWYYLDFLGEMLEDEFFYDAPPSVPGGPWYYLGTDGAMLSGGWKRVTETWEWADAWGNGHVDSYDFWIYAEASGRLACNQWKLINGVWYYFHGYRMVTGEWTIGGETYTFDESGAWVGD